MRWLVLLIAVAAGAWLAWHYLAPKEKPETPYADALLNALDRGRLEEVRGSFQTIHTGLTAYSGSEGQYPATSDIQSLVSTLTPNYIHNLNVTDPWGHPYAYTSAGPSYELRCAGKDGVAGNGDDVVMRDGQISMPKGFHEVNIR